MESIWKTNKVFKMKAKILNFKQRNFLIYIRDNHNSLGWKHTVEDALDTGKYDEFGYMKFIIDDWNKILETGTCIYGNSYGRPKKYLK